MGGQPQQIQARCIQYPACRRVTWGRIHEERVLLGRVPQPRPRVSPPSAIAGSDKGQGLMCSLLQGDTCQLRPSQGGTRCSLPPGAPYPGVPRAGSGAVESRRGRPCYHPIRLKVSPAQLVKPKAVLSPPSCPCVSFAPQPSPCQAISGLSLNTSWDGELTLCQDPCLTLGQKAPPVLTPTSVSVGFPVLVLAPAWTVPEPSAPPETALQRPKAGKRMSPREE